MTNLDIIKSEQNDSWSSNAGRLRSPVTGRLRSPVTGRLRSPVTGRPKSPVHSGSPVHSNQPMHPDVTFWRLLTCEREGDQPDQLISPSSSRSSESPPLLGGGYTGPSVNPLRVPSYTDSSSYLSTFGGSHPAESILPSNCSDIIKSMAAKYRRFEQYSSVLRKLSQIRSCDNFQASITEYQRRFTSPPLNIGANKPPNLPPIYPLKVDTNSQGVPSYEATTSSGFVDSPRTTLSSAQLLLSMARNAKSRRDEISSEEMNSNDQKFVSSKRPNESHPLDLSSSPPLTKRQRLESEEIDIVGESKSEPVSPDLVNSHQNGGSRSPVFKFNGLDDPNHEEEYLSNDPSKWSMEEVHQFVKSIDICAEYAESFLQQRIDGWCLSLLTECHLTATLNMKLGPALKLLSKLKELQESAKCSNCSSGSLNSGGHVNSSASGHVNSSASGHVNSSASGHVNSSLSGNVNSSVSGHVNSSVSGHVNSSVSGHVNSSASGHVNSSLSGQVNSSASGHVNSSVSGHVNSSLSGHVNSHYNDHFNNDGDAHIHFKSDYDVHTTDRSKFTTYSRDCVNSYVTEHHNSDDSIDMNFE